MARGGEETTSGRDELTFVDEALEHFTQGLVALEAGAREGDGVQGCIALAKGFQEVLTLEGVRGGILFGDRVERLAKPEDDGIVLWGGRDEAAEGSRLG